MVYSGAVAVVVVVVDNYIGVIANEDIPFAIAVVVVALLLVVIVLLYAVVAVANILLL